jgi:hypothetical protein
MMKVFSKEPLQIGRFNIQCSEMMFVQDMPIKMAHDSRILLPKNLEVFWPLVRAVYGYLLLDDYVYLSAKKLFTSSTCSWNRPGWHIDGFGTDDINFLWSDSYPTEFCVNQGFDLSKDHTLSMQEMEQQARSENIKTYDNGLLLRIDNTIVHRVANVKHEGYRTFAKISISKNKYNRVGTARNYLFDYDWDMTERTITRNDPSAKE